MTTLHLSEVAQGIAALDIKGVTIKDVDEMPNAIDQRECPVLGPSSHEPPFVTDWEQERISLAGNQRNTYTLNYKIFQAPVGSGRSIMQMYPEMVATAQVVVDAFMAISRVEGCQHIGLVDMPQVGPVVDASGQQFHGATISFRVVEF